MFTSILLYLYHVQWSYVHYSGVKKRRSTLVTRLSWQFGNCNILFRKHLHDGTHTKSYMYSLASKCLPQYWLYAYIEMSLNWQIWTTTSTRFCILYITADNIREACRSGYNTQLSNVQLLAYCNMEINEYTTLGLELHLPKYILHTIIHKHIHIILPYSLFFIWYILQLILYSMFKSRRNLCMCRCNVPLKKPGQTNSIIYKYQLLNTHNII